MDQFKKVILNIIVGSYFQQIRMESVRKKNGFKYYSDKLFSINWDASTRKSGFKHYFTK